jgi:hypothetical protein
MKLFFALVLIALFSIGASIAGLLDGMKPEAETRSSVVRDVLGLRHEFHLTGVSLIGAAGQSDEESHRLSAGTIVSRKRTGRGGLLVYHDFKEILASDVEIVIQLSADDKPLLSGVLDGTNSVFSPENLGRPVDEVSSDNGLYLTRAVFQNFSIKLQASGQTAFALTSEIASLDFASNILVLEGQVTIITSQNEEIHSSQAVFSSEFDGVLLPMGYAVGDEHFSGRAFLIDDGRGVLSAAAHVPDIDYADAVQKMEKALLAHVLEIAPPELRPLLFVLGMGGGEVTTLSDILGLERPFPDRGTLPPN